MKISAALLVGGVSLLVPIPLSPVNPNAPLPLPLSANPVPRPTNLATFVKDDAAAVRLGRAFFWDMQAGSDGVTARATPRGLSDRESNSSKGVS